MTDQEYKNAMEQLGPDPALRARVAAAVERGARPRLRLPRAALVAACLCLALTGTVFAASVISGRVHIAGTSILERKDTYGGVTPITVYTVEANGVAYVPLEAVSREARDFCASFTRMPQYKELDSWDEAERFLGLEIADNPLLDQAENTESRITDTYGRRHAGNCLIEFFGSFDMPTWMILSANYQFGGVDGCQISVYARLYTDAGDPDSNSLTRNWSTQRFSSTGDSLVLEEYTSPNGLEAVISTYAEDTPAQIRHAFIQCEFVLNGVYFDLHTTTHWDDGAEAVALMKQVVDAYS